MIEQVKNSDTSEEIFPQASYLKLFLSYKHLCHLVNPEKKKKEARTIMIILHTYAFFKRPALNHMYLLFDILLQRLFTGLKKFWNPNQSGHLTDDVNWLMMSSLHKCMLLTVIVSCLIVACFCCMFGFACLFVLFVTYVMFSFKEKDTK